MKLQSGRQLSIQVAHISDTPMAKDGPSGASELSGGDMNNKLLGTLAFIFALSSQRKRKTPRPLCRTL